ncbi:MAG: hypothetical protein HY760_03785 [Nitrospirae bacterium]|nr:hypothetical protein [Nitrospirota bacterium]
MNIHLFVIGAFFFLGLIGAVVLFRYLKSSALIKNEKYQAGGAIAGFLLIFGILFGAYDRLDKSDSERLSAQLIETRQALEALNRKLAANPIDGVLTPPLQNAKIVLAVKQTDADTRGRFRLSQGCIDPETDDVKLYVQTDNGRFLSYLITSKEEMNGITIPTGPVH